MFKFDATEFRQQKPVIQLAPLVDIAFWALIFFMAIAAFTQMESEMDIVVPKSAAASEKAQNAGKIIINISRNGAFIVNQQHLDAAQLEEMLVKVSKLFSNQQVIIRADELAYHKYVIQALDACMRSGIGDVSFATAREDIK